MAFYTILTDIGKAKLANATALGTTVSLQDIAVGDGGGVEVTPQTSDTALTNEVWRAALNNISIDSSNANWVVAEGYIPSDVGNFTIREVGLFDADGDMIAVGNYPDTYKPTLASGSAKDLYIKVIIEVSDAGVVELKVDPSVVLATRKYVDDETAKRALLQGDNTLTFKVADAVNTDEALSKGQLLSEIQAVDGAGSGIDADLVQGLPADFTSSKATNGYQKLPSGLIVQWGTVTLTATTTTGVSFPISFPNAIVHTSCEANDKARSQDTNIYNATISTFDIYTETSTPAVVNYIAIGY